MVLLQSRRGSVIWGWIYECPFCEREKSRDALQHTNDTQNGELVRFIVTTWVAATFLTPIALPAGNRGRLY